MASSSGAWRRAGHAGGLAATSTGAATVLDAAGFDLVLLETVGTGQSEVEVAAAADTTVVLEAPEMGDEVQAIKAGLLEVADIVVVNKGDRPGAQRTAAQLRAMLTSTASSRVAAGHPGAPASRETNGRAAAPKRPEVLITTASTGEGVPALLVALDRHRAARPRRAWPTPPASRERRRRSGRSSRSGSASASMGRRPGRPPSRRCALSRSTGSTRTRRPTGSWRRSRGNRRPADRGVAASGPICAWPAL